MIEEGRPRLLIEEWLPVAELGIESLRESSPIPGQFPKLKTLHVWWARRPLVASAGAILASLLPAWSPELADKFRDHEELSTPETYQGWYLHLCGIWGDPVSASLLLHAAKAAGYSIPNPYTYKQAYKNSPDTFNVELLHQVLWHTWGRIPEVCDPTAGGGSIPYEAVRYRLPSHANDLNPVAAAILRTGVEIPARYGLRLLEDLERWGSELVERLQARLRGYFPSLPDEEVATYLFARTIACPRTGKCVPLASDWALRRGSNPVAVRLVTERAGNELEEPEFEIVEGVAARFDTKQAGTWSRGKAVSPWDHLVIDSGYIKAEAKAGRMGEVLYAVANRTAAGRGFRAPSEIDLHALAAAAAELERLMPRWERDDVLPSERFPEGNDNRPIEYGMPRWQDMFTPRQLLVHGCFVEEWRGLVNEVQVAFADNLERAEAILGLLAMMHGKALNWNSRQATWTVGRSKIRATFDFHAFPFRNTFAEFEGALELPPWTLTQLLDAYGGIARLLEPSDVGRLSNSDSAGLAPASVTVTNHNAGNLASLANGSQTLVCIDPPYYDNVMYGELADYFYVWHKRTLGRLWPGLYSDLLTNKHDEAVTNKARFAHAGRKAATLANHDYTAKMAAIFAECHRVLTPDGVMTLMFTHKRADAWDSLGTALLQAGFEIRASWPVHTESEQSLHQARQNAVKSTVFLTCRKRSDNAVGDDNVYLEDIAADIRNAAGDALERGHAQGLAGVDLLLSTYGPALSVLSSQWPVYAAEADDDGRSRLLWPEEALSVARAEVLRRERMRLVGHDIEFDPLTDFTLLAWSTFGAREFPYDEARKLALSISDLDLDNVESAKLVTAAKGSVRLAEPRLRLRRETDAHLPGIDRSRTVVGVWVDAIHTAAYITAQDGPGAAKRWLDERDLSENAVFESCLQAFVRALPNTKHQGVWNVAEAEHLHSLVKTYFENIELPAEPAEFESEDLSLPGIADD